MQGATHKIFRAKICNHCSSGKLGQHIFLEWLLSVLTNVVNLTSLISSAVIPTSYEGFETTI
jgi:hypothetical protein